MDAASTVQTLRMGINTAGPSMEMTSKIVSRVKSDNRSQKGVLETERDNGAATCCANQNIRVVIKIFWAIVQTI
jgi:hypothetical protein